MSNHVLAVFGTFNYPIDDMPRGVSNMYSTRVGHLDTSPCSCVRASEKKTT